MTTEEWCPVHLKEHVNPCGPLHDITKKTLDDPEQVPVNVADLELLLRLLGTYMGAHPHTVQEVVDRLGAAIPEPEWEPTDDMLDVAERVVKPWMSRDVCRSMLQAMHRERLL